MPIYINKNGQQSGPYEDHIVRDQLTSGVLSTNDMAIRHGDATWQKLGDMFPGVGRSSSPPPVAAAGEGVRAAASTAMPLATPTKAAGGCRKPLGWTILAIGILVMLGGSAVAIATPYGYSTLSCDFADKDAKEVDELMAKYQAAKGTSEEGVVKYQLESAMAGYESSAKVCADQNSTKKMFQLGSIAIAIVGFFMVIVGFFIRR
ncbi:MAG TPA: DUF4339 domain-containing protein [Pyrinomonadaceae bacterium]|nr:DUF4339 domain-containing protein [Pyrinomonadaceae bacterium]